MRLRALLVAACLAAPAVTFAQPSDCDAIRRVLAIAERYSLDVGDLLHLEPQLCGKPQGRVACQQLDEFWMLAMALEQPSETLNALEAQRAVWCGREDEPPRPLQWPNGATLRTSSGALSWPTGTLARSSGGTWSAPSGTMVRTSSGSLSYPSGTLARSSSGRWTLPNGTLAEEGRLAALACEQELSWCRFFLSEAAQSSGVRRDFALLGLARMAGPRD